MLIELITVIIIAEACKFIISLRDWLINFDNDVINYVVSKYGKTMGIAYVVLIGPFIEELGFRIVPWFITHSTYLIIVFSILWWVGHVGNFKYARSNAVVKLTYLIAVGLGGISYVSALLINPLLPLVLHVVNNAYSTVLVKSRQVYG